MRGVIIIGSSRSQGNTRTIVDFLNNILDFDIVDLKEKKIAAFDYEFQNQGDDFLPLIKKIVRDYDLLIFATPVYWYSMSGIMKTFFDRLSDCLKIEKEVGRKLRGKKMAALCCGNDHLLVSGFFEPFENSANYLGMNYLGDVNCWMESVEISDEVKSILEKFSETIKMSSE